MIHHLRGTITHKQTNEVVIECNGVGYVVVASIRTIEQLPSIGNEAMLLTIYQQREDMVQIFGFASEDERTFFRLLTSISGIGGKIAIGMLSATNVDDMQRAVLENNLVFLQKLPGVGKKTAERIVIELRDKMTSISSTSQSVNMLSAVQIEAVAALQSLGFSKSIAEKSIQLALKNHPTSINSIETLIKHALRFSMA
jgi:Holliday junction DNA helicase RuvA